MSPLSIRGKMTLAALAPLCVVLLLGALSAFYVINARVVGEAQKKVRNDLNAAHEVLSHEEERVRDVVRFTAHASGLTEAVRNGDLSRVAVELESIRRREGLDLLNLTDPGGRVLLRSTATAAGDAAPLPFLEQVLDGEDFSGAVLLDGAAMEREGEALAERARVPRTGIAEERRGLFLIGAAAVHGEKDRVIGCLYGGVLLNGNLALVDRIKDIVYGGETFSGTETGSATIFLEDLRVATTVRLRDGARALGTRVSAEVAEAVLERRETWLARARVVDRWYLTAYEPILDPAGRAIGALYVGLLEEPFTALKGKAWLMLTLLLLLGGGLGFFLARLGSRRLAGPLLHLAAGAERVADGERGVRLPVASRDEVGHLTEAFNRMTEALGERDQQLRDLAWDLERKVEERTAQLEEKSLELIRTQEELLRSEKLAAIGSLAAGVAHEINNPAAIIRGNVEILMMGFPPGSAGREEVEEILKQTERVSLITQNMLAFAREQAICPEMLQVNRIVEEVLGQVSHQVPLAEVEIRTDLDPGVPPIVGDGERLRQVFTNIVINALQAMAGGGILSVCTRRADGGVVVDFADNGPGIPPELRHKIFNPFFTTKKRGSGLGLSVSYGIVKAHGGSIEVDSSPETGTTFRLHLPLQGGA